MTSRAKMCLNKTTFWNRASAERHAEKFKQRVYECPVCYCWHCTSKENWQNEFITIEQNRKSLAHLECKLRTEFKAKRKELTKRIMQLEQENQERNKIIDELRSASPASTPQSGGRTSGAHDSHTTKTSHS